MKIPLGLKLSYSPVSEVVTAEATLKLSRGSVVFEVTAKDLSRYGNNEEGELTIKHEDTEILKLNKDLQPFSQESLSELSDETRAGLLLFSVIGEELLGFYFGARERMEKQGMFGRSQGETMKELHRFFRAESSISEEFEGSVEATPEQFAWFDSFPVTQGPTA